MEPNTGLSISGSPPPKAFSGVHDWSLLLLEPFIYILQWSPQINSVTGVLPLRVISGRVHSWSLSVGFTTKTQQGNPSPQSPTISGTPITEVHLWSPHHWQPQQGTSSSLDGIFSGFLWKVNIPHLRRVELVLWRHIHIIFHTREQSVPATHTYTNHNFMFMTFMWGLHDKDDSHVTYVRTWLIRKPTWRIHVGLIQDAWCIFAILMTCSWWLHDNHMTSYYWTTWEAQEKYQIYTFVTRTVHDTHKSVSGHLWHHTSWRVSASIDNYHIYWKWEWEMMEGRLCHELDWRPSVDWTRPREGDGQREIDKQTGIWAISLAVCLSVCTLSVLPIAPNSRNVRYVVMLLTPLCPLPFIKMRL